MPPTDGSPQEKKDSSESLVEVEKAHEEPRCKLCSTELQKIGVIHGGWLVMTNDCDDNSG